VQLFCPTQDIDFGINLHCGPPVPASLHWLRRDPKIFGSGGDISVTDR